MRLFHKTHIPIFFRPPLSYLYQVHDIMFLACWSWNFGEHMYRISWADREVLLYHLSEYVIKAES
jgi:hypothetical protein